MKVYIANFGRENYEWPVCKSRGTVATMNDVGIQPLWAAGNREGYLQRAMLGKTAAGISPPKTVASRWFNLMTIIAETEHDLWIHNGRQKAAWRMADTAMKTVAHSNGQQVLSTMKNKDLGFASQIELEKYIIGLLDIQEGICALTDLPYYLDGDTEDRAMLCSLDRIDSSGHYARGNLQIVCRFANEWKGSRDNADFRRLIGAVRSVQALS